MDNVLYIFVEGNDDERFFEEVIVPILRRKYVDIKIIKYAQKPKKFEYIRRYIKSIQSMGRDYMYVTDVNSSPCVTAKKEEIRGSLGGIDDSKILVVVKEIESWYLAGVDADSEKELKIGKIPPSTETLTKEDFSRLIPRKFGSSRIDFLREILKKFSIETAKQRNRSLRYCIEKYDC